MEHPVLRFILAKWSASVYSPSHSRSRPDGPINFAVSFALETLGLDVKNILQIQYEVHRNPNMTKCSQYNCRIDHEWWHYHDSRSAWCPETRKEGNRHAKENQVKHQYPTSPKSNVHKNQTWAHAPRKVQHTLFLAQCGSTGFLRYFFHKKRIGLGNWAEGAETEVNYTNKLLGPSQTTLGVRGRQWGKHSVGLSKKRSVRPNKIGKVHPPAMDYHPTSTTQGTIRDGQVPWHNVQKMWKYMKIHEHISLEMSVGTDCRHQNKLQAPAREAYWLPASPFIRVFCASRSMCWSGHRQSRRRSLCLRRCCGRDWMNK